MWVWAHVCTYVYIYVCICDCEYIYMCVCVCVCLRVCVCLCVLCMSMNISVFYYQYENMEHMCLLIYTELSQCVNGGYFHSLPCQNIFGLDNVNLLIPMGCRHFGSDRFRGRVWVGRACITIYYLHSWTKKKNSWCLTFEFLRTIFFSKNPFFPKKSRLWTVKIMVKRLNTD